MAEPRFSPDELDRIEDALEDLEVVDAFRDPSPQVRDLLESYRGILVATREALPLEDVPHGVLAAVFAEAHASTVGAPTLAPTPEPDAPRPSLWARVRASFLVPSLALAGTAGLVLWLARPQDGADGVDRVHETVASAAPADAAQKDQVDALPVVEESVEAAAEEKNAQSPASPAAAPPPQTIGGIRQQAGDPEPEAAPDADTPLDAQKAELGKLGEAPGSKRDAKEIAEPEAGAARWDLIERADRARQDGDCAAARSDYGIATEDDDAGVRSRAYAGLGLCNMQSGDDAGAEDAFERARGIDPGVGKYIEAERSPSGNYSPAKPKPSNRKAKKSAPSSTSKAKTSSKSADQASNPFDPSVGL